MGIYMDIATMETAEFADPDAGGVKQSNFCPVFWIFNRINDPKNLFPGGDNGKPFIKMEKRNLPPVPVFMENIVIEVSEL